MSCSVGYGHTLSVGGVVDGYGCKCGWVSVFISRLEEVTPVMTLLRSTGHQRKPRNLEVLTTLICKGS